jgi:hypothetical protein
MGFLHTGLEGHTLSRRSSSLAASRSRSTLISLCETDFRFGSVRCLMLLLSLPKQTNKQASKQANKRTSERANKRTNKQTNKHAQRDR